MAVRTQDILSGADMKLLTRQIVTMLSTNLSITTFPDFVSFRGKKFRIFGFGDYEYLCKMYGLAGASGKQLCFLFKYSFYSMSHEKLLL